MESYTRMSRNLTPRMWLVVDKICITTGRSSVTFAADSG